MIAFRLVLPFTLGYYLSYVFRTMNAVLAPDLVRELGIDGSGLGLLTSAYFLAFAAFQLPLGVLLDRFGARRTEAVLLLVAAVGAVVFAIAAALPGLVLGRALIGLGVSACLMAPLKAYRQWFPEERLPLINGIQWAAGGLGAMTATAPVEAALHLAGWRGVFVALAVASVVISAIIYFIVPEKPIGGHKETLREQIGGIRTVFSSREFWRLAPMTLASQGGFLAIQGLWSGPWLRDVGLFDRDGVAQALLLIAAGMTAGFFSMGAAAERLRRVGISTTAVAVGALVIFMAIQACVIGGWREAALPLWVLFGFFGTGGSLLYAALPDAFPVSLSGRVGTALNLLVFTTAFAFQWGIGVVIDLWPRTAGGGFAAEGYRAGFGVVLALQLMALLWYALSPRPKPLRA